MFKCICLPLHSHKFKRICLPLHSQKFKTVSRGVMAKLTTLTRRQRQSSKDAEKIREACGRLFVVAMTTRWNSTYDSIVCLRDIDATGKLDKICRVIGLQCFNPSEKMFLKEFCMVCSCYHFFNILEQLLLGRN